MSAQNGQRARFHLNRKRRVLQRMRVRALRQTLNDAKIAAAAGTAPAGPANRGGPALAAS